MSEIVLMEYFGPAWGYYKIFPNEGRLDRAKASTLELLRWIAQGKAVKNESNRPLPAFIREA